MKNPLLFLLIVLYACANAQWQPQENTQQLIIQSEQKAAQVSHQKHAAQGASDTYDLYYAIAKWEIDPAIKYIQGSVHFRFKPHQGNLSQLEFDMHDSLTVDSIIYHNTSLTFSRTQNNILEVQLPAPLASNSNDSLTIYYQGKPVSNGFGSFEQNSHNNTPIIWTLSEPYGAMEWWPTKQSLNDKIDSLDVFVTATAGNKVAGNGKLVSEITIGSNVTTHWKSRNPIAAYLVAFAVTNYSAYSEYANLRNGPLEILNYVYPENLTKAQTETPATIEILELFDSLTIPYPFSNEKYGHAQFGWGGGMEHQTMSFMGGFPYSLIAHEAAHQWFGDHVTCGSWHDIWLNEGFATYFEGLTVERYQSIGLWNYWKSLKIQHITSAPDGSVYVDDTTSIPRIFSGRLSYDKGAMVINMLRYQIGDSAFFTGLTNYLSDPNLAGGYAKTADLQKHLEASSGQNLTTFFNQWIYGQGYPTYQISWGQSGNNVTITVNQTQSHPSVSFYEMPLPIRLEGLGRDTIIRLENTSNGQVFNVDVPWHVSKLVFNHNLELICGDAQVVSLNEFGSASPFHIYPNPVEDILRLDYSNQDIKPSKVEIINAKGQVVQTMDFSKNLLLESLPTGAYILKIYVDDEYYNHSFLKE
ncbi:aminopeptidase N [Owenweeksia hongkongensis DSM 17368]|uniref:Aminopeptidase N n=1 Tax=Owenweeksia hongkongensis (strain DSM 17368 / CIP 108786 / JCM 12287 / NRRL B-23963 / UST20020801) TaxID=926562 RepID=G8QZS2_OWEHD|nr:M1 family aminopeptidase [Owenweeksia hongkongensis]AEV31516.1 aminopeptidase N [Owenweeksia hongkongensis DSM 17368]